MSCLRSAALAALTMASVASADLELQFDGMYAHEAIHYSADLDVSWDADARERNSFAFAGILDLNGGELRAACIELAQGVSEDLVPYDKQPFMPGTSEYERSLVLASLFANSFDDVIASGSNAMAAAFAEACEAGGSTFYGTGMNPGLNQVLGVVCTADVADITNVTTIESVDVSCHHSADTWREVGYGRPVDDPALPAMLQKFTEVFADSVHLKADCFGLELDEVRFEYELGACTKDVYLGWYHLPKGSLGGSYIKFVGVVDDVPRVETHLEWQMTPHTDPSWDIKGCYITQVTGDPQIYNKHMVFPGPGNDLSRPEDFASLGMTVTGMPALHSIRAVHEARPGIITSADLPLRAFGGRFSPEVRQRG